jgi:tetratricopeptide (TPR) repeat protein
MKPTPLAIALLAALAGAIAFTACLPAPDDANAVRRGDEAAARGALDEALAEYRLAVRQGSEDGTTLARVAHTYVQMRRVDEATDFYRQAIAADPELADQAASEMLRMATASEARNDLFGVASAMEAAMEFQPGVTVPELALPLARHYDRNGEHGIALAYYQRALSAMEGDTIPAVLFETASAFDQIGDCRRALLFYEQYRGMLRRWQRDEVNWKIGNCSYNLARELRQEGAREEALLHVERTVALGQPMNVQALAYFEMGEILAELGRCEEAMVAFQRVEGADQTGDGPLVERARWRFDELRFVGPTGQGTGTGSDTGPDTGRGC